MPEEDYLRPSPIRFDDDSYQVCYDYWSSLRGPRWAPVWREWDWGRIPSMLIPYFIVVDVKHDPVDFIYRFWGTANLDMHDVEMTGKSVDDIRYDPMKQQIIQQYRETVEKRQPIGPMLTVKINGQPDEHRQISLRMPLSRDGEKVDMIVSFADWRQTHATIRQKKSITTTQLRGGGGKATSATHCITNAFRSVFSIPNQSGYLPVSFKHSHSA